jgi:hypothetical protein
MDLKYVTNRVPHKLVSSIVISVPLNIWIVRVVCWYVILVVNFFTFIWNDSEEKSKAAKAKK